MSILPKMYGSYSYILVKINKCNGCFIGPLASLNFECYTNNNTYIPFVFIMHVAVLGLP